MQAQLLAKNAALEAENAELKAQLREANDTEVVAAAMDKLGALLADLKREAKDARAALADEQTLRAEAEEELRLAREELRLVVGDEMVDLVGYVGGVARDLEEYRAARAHVKELKRQEEQRLLHHKRGLGAPDRPAQTAAGRAAPAPSPSAVPTRPDLGDAGAAAGDGDLGADGDAGGTNASPEKVRNHTRTHAYARTLAWRTHITHRPTHTHPHVRTHTWHTNTRTRTRTHAHAHVPTALRCCGCMRRWAPRTLSARAGAACDRHAERAARGGKGRGLGGEARGSGCATASGAPRAAPRADRGRL